MHTSACNVHAHICRWFGWWPLERLSSLALTLVWASEWPSLSSSSLGGSSCEMLGMHTHHPTHTYTCTHTHSLKHSPKHIPLSHTNTCTHTHSPKHTPTPPHAHSPKHTHCYSPLYKVVVLHILLPPSTPSPPSASLGRAPNTEIFRNRKDFKKVPNTIYMHIHTILTANLSVLLSAVTAGVERGVLFLYVHMYERMSVHATVISCMVLCLQSAQHSMTHVIHTYVCPCQANCCRLLIRMCIHIPCYIHPHCSSQLC